MLVVIPQPLIFLPQNDAIPFPKLCILLGQA